MKALIKLGRGVKIEKGARAGYRPQRPIRDLSLVIGAKSHIRRGTIIYLGSHIGNRLETGHNVIIREENKIGDNLAVWSNSIIDYGCRIGRNVKIHSNCYIAQFTALEDGVFLAPGVIIANDLHPGCRYSRECMKGPVIKRGAQVGANVTILPRVVIGAGALIGAGSVVSRDIPAGAVAYGNPARVHAKTSQLTCTTGLTKRPY
jgi:acetyltransferase-like isoleucine patch superfamily enzyme